MSRDDIKNKKNTKGFRKNLINLFMPSNNSNNMNNTFLNNNTSILSNKFVKQLKK